MLSDRGARRLRKVRGWGFISERAAGRVGGSGTHTRERRALVTHECGGLLDSRIRSFTWLTVPAIFSGFVRGSSHTGVIKKGD